MKRPPSKQRCAVSLLWNKRATEDTQKFNYGTGRNSKVIDIGSSNGGCVTGVFCVLSVFK
jgi:hypothetical protein